MSVPTIINAGTIITVDSSEVTTQIVQVTPDSSPSQTTLVQNLDKTYSVDLSPDQNFGRAARIFTLQAQQAVNWPQSGNLWARVSPNQQSTSVLTVEIWVQSNGVAVQQYKQLPYEQLTFSTGSTVGPGNTTQWTVTPSQQATGLYIASSATPSAVYLDLLAESIALPITTLSAAPGTLGAMGLYYVPVIGGPTVDNQVNPTEAYANEVQIELPATGNLGFVWEIDTPFLPFSSAAGGGGLTLIENIVLSANQVSVTFSDIPNSFNNLELIWQARSIATSQETDIMQVQFNGDSNDNYDSCYLMASGSSLLAGIWAQANTVGYLGYILGAAATANMASEGKLLIPNYKNTTFYKSYENQFGGTDFPSATAHTYGGKVWGQWRQTAAIDEITLFCEYENLGFAAGSSFSLYGS